jgi:hypothetical protein
MKGGKIDKGGTGRKRPARPTEAEKSRAGPKRGDKQREWGAFETDPTRPPATPPKRTSRRTP